MTTCPFVLKNIRPKLCEKYRNYKNYGRNLYLSLTRAHNTRCWCLGGPCNHTPVFIEASYVVLFRGHPGLGSWGANLRSQAGGTPKRVKKFIVDLCGQQ